MNAIFLYRIGHWCVRRRVPVVPRLCWGVNYLLFNAHIPCTAVIGPGTRFGYGGMGVVVHSDAKIGANCLISQQVTIGGKSRCAIVPTLGDDVYVGAGARILGPITIGDGAVVGANAVVVKDVAARSIVAGVPARVIAEDVDVSDYR